MGSEIGSVLSNVSVNLARVFLTPVTITIPTTKTAKAPRAILIQ
jgi:hypothetical protein